MLSRFFGHIPLIVGLVTTILGFGCESEPPLSEAPLFISWTFADGRSCSEASVVVVTVGEPHEETRERFDCESGLGHPVPAGTFARSKPLVIEGLSAGGAPLYRAITHMPAGNPVFLDVILIFVGGAPLP